MNGLLAKGINGIEGGTTGGGTRICDNGDMLVERVNDDRILVD